MPTVTCACGQRTRMLSGVCRACAEDLSVNDADSPNVLDTEGWYNDHGIMRHLGWSA